MVSLDYDKQLVSVLTPPHAHITGESTAMRKHKYYVSTYDSRYELFTPQPGVRTGPYTLFGLRKALRELRNHGYDIGRDAPSVLVERDDYRVPPKEAAVALTAAKIRIKRDKKPYDKVNRIADVIHLLQMRY